MFSFDRKYLLGISESSLLDLLTPLNTRELLPPYILGFHIMLKAASSKSHQLRLDFYFHSKADSSVRTCKNTIHTTTVNIIQ